MKTRLIQNYVLNSVKVADGRERNSARMEAERGTELRDNTNSTSQMDTNMPFYRPLWCKDGFISRDLVQEECERLSRVSLKRGRGTAAAGTDASRDEQRSVGGSSTSSESGRKRKKARKNDDDNTCVGRAVIGKT